ncbi:MAG: PP2C family protein-serine/threonine phosphatase [Planctomycetota bacterium]|jgi:serine phosphatase RsbU (regulator of sigma subunit)
MPEKRIFQFQSESFSEAALRSERVRIIGMIVLLAFVVIVSIVRIVRPIPEAPHVGWILAGLHGAYLLYECLMLRIVERRLARGEDVVPAVWRFNAAAESLLPLFAMANGILFTNLNPYVVMLMPALPFILVLMIMSTLRIDPLLCGLGGIVSTIGYSVIVVYVFARFPETYDGSLHHWSIYVFMILVLMLGTTVATFVAGQARQHVIAALHEAEVKRQKERMEADLGIARTIQQNLLPQRVPDVAGYEVAARSVPADQTGGDYYDWQPLADGRTVISLADVTGHGVGPALVTAACRAYVRAIANHETSPHDVLERVNRLLHEDVPEGRFVTFALFELDSNQHHGVLLAAGHGPSFYVTGESGELTSIDAQGLPLAVLEEQVMESAVTFDFSPGDLVTLFSDGFFEWTNEAGEQFGLERLRAVVRENRHESAAAIIERMDDAVRTFAGSQPQPDDMTVVVIKRNAG